MEIEPDFEFDAPKWYDFAAEHDANVSLNDSWFEKVHPLHEPKDPSHHDATNKPLLKSNHSNKAAATSSKVGKSSKQPTKIYNSKKSLGIKTVRTRRGEHENPNTVESNEKSIDNRKLKSDSGDRKTLQGLNQEDNRMVSPVEISQQTDQNLAPPWSSSPLNKTGESFVYHGEVRDGSSSSSMGDAAMFSPQHEPVNLTSPGVKSPVSSTRVRCLSSLSVSSASPFSPKNSLLVKAASGTACSKSGKFGKRRRLLPSVPDQKMNPATLPPSTDECPPNNGMFSMESLRQAEKPSHHWDTETEQLQQDRENSNGSPHKPEKICIKESNRFNKRSLNVIPEQANVKDRGTYSNSTLLDESKNVPVHRSIEELLREHNRKIAAARNQYDENGRKIRTAVPSFCPAPSQKITPLSAASKRPTSSLEKTSAAAKHKRRSCVAAVNNMHSVTDLRSQPLPSNTTGNRKGKDQLSKPTSKQKRRSCAAIMQSSEHVDNTEKELRDLIARHNLKVTAKRS